MKTTSVYHSSLFTCVDSGWCITQGLVSVVKMNKGAYALAGCQGNQDHLAICCEGNQRTLGFYRYLINSDTVKIHKHIACYDTVCSQHGTLTSGCALHTVRFFGSSGDCRWSPKVSPIPMKDGVSEEEQQVAGM